MIEEAVVPEYPVTDQMRWEDEHFPEDCYEYYRQGIPRIVPDVAIDEWAECLVEFMQQVCVKSKVVAPIVQVYAKFSRKVWGLLIVHACSHYRQWQKSEVEILQRICDQLAIAINQANLYQQLQRKLAEHQQTEEALRESEELFRKMCIRDRFSIADIYVSCFLLDIVDRRLYRCCVLSQALASVFSIPRLVLNLVYRYHLFPATSTGVCLHFDYHGICPISSQAQSNQSDLHCIIRLSTTLTSSLEFFIWLRLVL